ncbi:hypothetical protein [Microlunatus ginsengisoli]|uniref:Big-1 domain-containing protein n=1 Tax=Microlunatus ginsengisoli TaxID=363863 RepID=A0ABP7AII8_9ACTN
MSPDIIPARPTPKTTAVALLIILAMLITGTVTFLTRETLRPETAAADTSHKRTKGTHGVGYVIDGQWIGTWRITDGTGFCIEFDKDHPDSTGAGTLHGRVPGMSAEESERVKYVANHYGLTTSKVDGAAAAIYVWKTQNTSRFNSFYAKLLKKKMVSKAIRDRVSQIAAEAANHGPYKLSMTMGSGLPGQTVSGVVTIKATNGKAVAGRTVALTAKSAGTVAGQDKASNAKGQLRFSVKVTGTGTVRIDAKLTTPAAGGVWITRPTSGHQRLVLAGKATESATATVSSHRSTTGPSLASACTGNCGGAAPVTLTASNPCGAATLREIVYVDGKALTDGTLDVAACKTGTKTFTVTDDAVVTTKYCYLAAGGTCAGAPTTNSGSLTVTCPPLPTYRFSATCPCGKDRQLTYEVQAPAGSRRSYAVTLTVKAADGSTWTRSATLTGGWQALPTATLAKGSTATLTVTVLGRTTTLDSLSESA